MVLTPITTTWQPGDIIPASWANTLGQNQGALDVRTGSPGPGGAAKFLVSTGPDSGSWRLLQGADFGNTIIPDAAMVNQKVDRLQLNATSFAAAAGLLSGFLRVSNGGAPVVDAPSAAGDWYLLQQRHVNLAVDYRWQFACDLGNANEMYVRLIVGGSPTAWRRLHHDGNVDALLKTGGVMSGGISFADTLEGITLSGGTQIRDDTAGTFQILANNDRLVVFTQSASGILADIAVGGITAPRFISSVALGTAPFGVSSNTLVPLLNADLLDGMHASEIIAAAAGTVPGLAAGIGAYWTSTAASIPPGWARNANANGRVLVGDGTTFGQTFVVNNPYGTAWAHAHTLSGHGHGVNGHEHTVAHDHGANVVGGPSGPTFSVNGDSPGDYRTITDAHGHVLSVGSNTPTTSNVGGSTGGPSADFTNSPIYIPPAWGVVWIVKT